MKNIVICANLQEEGLNLLKTFKDSDLLKGANVKIVHCFEIQMYASEFTPYFYPPQDKYGEVKEGCEKILSTLKEEIEKSTGVGQVTIEVMFSQGPREKIKSYLEDNKTDLAVIATRGKHGIEGLFTSSFAEFMVKFSPCDLHILRPLK